MNKFHKILFGVASLFMLAGCSNDFDPNNGKEENDKDAPGVYLGVNFKMPGMGQTRSITDNNGGSNNGEEVGTDIENNVNEVLLILADKNYGYIASGTVLKNNIYKHTGSATTETTYHAIAKVSKTSLNTYYENCAKADPQVDPSQITVFVIANPTGGMTEALANTNVGDKEWINTPWHVTVNGQQTEGSIWSSAGDGSFLMTNSEIAIRQIPASIDGWNNYSTEDNCFNLSAINTGSGTSIDNSESSDQGVRGPVKVQRAAARFDFRDGSPLGGCKYHVVFLKDANGQNDETKPLIDIQLNKMGLVNMNNAFYYFKRVSDNGLNTGWNAAASTNGWSLCGKEKPWFSDANGVITPLPNTSGNYVVDFYATEKNGEILTGFSKYFNYSFFDDNGTLNNANIQAGNDRWYVSEIKSVLNGKGDNWEGGGDAHPKGQYKVWRYLTENTIPGDARNQRNGISTGIVFKGKMIANTEREIDLTTLTAGSQAYKLAEWNNKLIQTINSSDPDLGDQQKAPVLYSYAGSLYLTWENVYEAAIAASFSYTTDANGKIVPTWNRSNTFYKAVFGTGGTGYTLTVDNETYTDDLAEDESSANYCWNQWNKAGKPGPQDAQSALYTAYKQAVTKNGIAMYQRSHDAQEGWGYYCYYYYWNRHNDNGRAGIMGPMEFAVVRNNVYKLAVTKIAKLGHPRLPENDPEKPDPKTPDETSDVYLTVDAKVIPWVVRVNDIVFE